MSTNYDPSPLMYPAHDNSKKLGPAWAFLAGGALLAVAAGILSLVVVGLLRGEILKLSKHHSGLVTRTENPGSFWFSVIYSVVIGLLLALRALWILRDARRERQRVIPPQA